MDARTVNTSTGEITGIDPRNVEGVYIIHFSPRYKHAGHYLGYAKNVQARIRQHGGPSGGNLPKHAYQAGCTMHLVRVIHGASRTTERAFKYNADGRRKHSLTPLCPICNPRIAAKDPESIDLARAIAANLPNVV